MVLDFKMVVVEEIKIHDRECIWISDLKYVFSGPLQKSVLTPDLTFSKYWGQHFNIWYLDIKICFNIGHSPHFLVKKQKFTELWEENEKRRKEVVITFHFHGTF